MLELFDEVDDHLLIQTPYSLIHQYCHSTFVIMLAYLFILQKGYTTRIRTSKPHKLRDKSAHTNDLDKPNNNILLIVPNNPCKITGLLPMRSDNIPQCIPIYDVSIDN